MRWRHWENAQQWLAAGVSLQANSRIWAGRVYYLRFSLIVMMEDANSLARFPPRWSRNCDGCWWSRLETWRTAKGHLGRAATGCCPSPTPSVYSSWSSRTHRVPQSLNESGRRWWCRCWGPGSSEGTCQAWSCAGRGLTGSHQVRAPVWWRVPSDLMCRQTWRLLKGHERGPGSPTPTWRRNKSDKLACLFIPG